MIDDSNVRSTQSENLHSDSEVGEAGERPAGDELVRVIGQDELFNSMRKGAAEAEQRATDRWPATVQLGSIADWLSRTHLATAEFRCSGASQDAKHARTYPHGDPLGEALRQPVSVDAGADDAQYASGTEGTGTGTTRATSIPRARTRRPTIKRPRTSSPMPAESAGAAA